MTLRFGTDGVRGIAGVELTPEFAVALGRAAAHVLGAPLLLGRDTRESGAMIEAAFAAGAAAAGVDVDVLGVLPTPAVAWHAANDGKAAAVVSASHNPYRDNGIKLFAPGGLKLPDEVESAIEAAAASPPAPSPAVGAIRRRDAEAVQPYRRHLEASLGGRGLDGLHVVLDCANGAASHVAPAVVEALGARVEVIHASPDGRNINDGCGSTHPADLQARVLEVGADAGLAFDGDADRVLAVDHRGRLVDGDHVIAMCAIDLASRGLLRHRTVVVTVMTNLGFRLAMAERGLEVVETPVGDRHVLEALRAGGFSLGGEQSGHVIFRDLASTGDGTLTGLQVLDLLCRSGRPLADLADEAMTSLPQVLHNVRVAARGVDVSSAVAEDLAAAEAALGPSGRILLRPSGTEPLVRVMVEAPTLEQADEVARRLAAAVARAAG